VRVEHAHSINQDAFVKFMDDKVHKEGANPAHQGISAILH